MSNDGKQFTHNIQTEDIDLVLGNHESDTTCMDDVSQSHRSPPISYEVSDQIRVQKLVLHRGHVFNELLDYAMHFQPLAESRTIEVEMIMPNGQTEAAEDTGGVFRDAISEFWSTFYKGYTNGNHVKVPALIHTMTADHWRAIATIVVLAYKQTGYFPTELALPFVQTCVTGFATPTDDDDLLKAFLLYVPDGEKDILVKALTNFEEISEDELLDTLDAYSIRTVPSQLNIQDIVLQLAHRELIQAPAYVADCWHELFLTLDFKLDIRSVIADLEPTGRKVINSLDVSDNLTVHQRTTLEFLRKYIRSLSQEMLKLFLRYCTGSDLMITKKITVTFVDGKSEFSRMPIAHTCGSVLELPTTYEDYVQLRKEFNSILESRIWVMDII